MSKLATSEIWIFQLVSVAEQAGLNLNVSESPKTGFLTSFPIVIFYVCYRDNVHCDE